MSAEKLSFSPIAPRERLWDPGFVKEKVDEVENGELRCGHGAISATIQDFHEQRFQFDGIVEIHRRAS